MQKKTNKLSELDSIQERIDRFLVDSLPVDQEVKNTVKARMKHSVIEMTQLDKQSKLAQPLSTTIHTDTGLLHV